MFYTVHSMIYCVTTVVTVVTHGRPIIHLETTGTNINKGIINNLLFCCPLKIKNKLSLCISSMFNRGLPIQIGVFSKIKHHLQSLFIAQSLIYFIIIICLQSSCASIA